MAAFLKKKTSVAAINITLGVPGQRADNKLGKRTSQWHLQDICGPWAGLSWTILHYKLHNPEATVGQSRLEAILCPPQALSIH